MARRAQELDPLSPYGFGMISIVLANSHEYEGCIVAACQGLAIDPDYLACLWPQGFAYAGLGRHHEAVEHFEKVVAVSGRVPYHLAHLG